MNLVTTWKLTVVLRCYTSQMRAVVSGTACSRSGEGLIFITQLTSSISITLAIYYCIWDLWGTMKIFSVFFQVHLRVLENAVPDFPHWKRIYNFRKNIAVYHGDPQFFLVVMPTVLFSRADQTIEGKKNLTN